MQFFFADDSRQDRPSRLGMRAFIAVGGFYIDSSFVKKLEAEIQDLCIRYGFPDGPAGEFKWSPNRRAHWMYQGLTGAGRRAFYDDLFHMATSFGVTAAVIIEDTGYKTASSSSAGHEEDAVLLLLERVETRLARLGDDGIVIADQPSAGKNLKYLADCLHVIQSGTSQVCFQHIALNVLSTPSHLVRCLQLADVITACSLSLVAGEPNHAPHVFPHMPATPRALGSSRRRRAQDTSRYAISEPIPLDSRR